MRDEHLYDVHGCTNAAGGRKPRAAGEDRVTGKNYEHRKTWAIERLALLADVFAVEVASFSIMSNHIHLLLRVDKQKALAWDDHQVAKRW